MSLQNRVNPYGEIVAIASRGAWMGNRGCLHGADRQLTSTLWKRKAWIICELSYHDRRRNVMAPGEYTELFFLDEATALATGHRPCGTCRKAALSDFVAAWRSLNGQSGSGLSVLYAYFAAILQVTGMDRGESFPLKKFMRNFPGHEGAGLIVNVGSGNFRLSEKGIQYFRDRFQPGNPQHITQGEVDRFEQCIRRGGGNGWSRVS